MTAWQDDSSERDGVVNTRNNIYSNNREIYAVCPMTAWQDDSSERASNVSLLPFYICYVDMPLNSVSIMNSVSAWIGACLTAALRLAVRSPLPGCCGGSQYIL